VTPQGPKPPAQRGWGEGVPRSLPTRVVKVSAEEEEQAKEIHFGEATPTDAQVKKSRNMSPSHCCAFLNSSLQFILQ